MATKFVRFTGLMLIAALAARGYLAAPRLPEALPRSFMAELTIEAGARLSFVRAIYVPVLEHPIAFYFGPLDTVFYGPNATPGELRHEAMHVLDPCHFDLPCERAFERSLPAGLAQTARDLYGRTLWSDAEYWPVIPAWYEWQASEMPAAVRAAYVGIFR